MYQILWETNKKLINNIINKNNKQMIINIKINIESIVREVKIDTAPTIDIILIVRIIQIKTNKIQI